MYVETDLTAAAVLREPDDFRSLKVVVNAPGDDRGRLADALASVGRLDGEGNAFLEIEALKRLAGDRAADAEWLGSFDAMVGYARGKGWVDADGAALQAHCEWHVEAAG
jgi:hypothetical protein